jgi:quinate dehydrogenase
MPIKSKVLEYLDEISPEGKATGACNTIVPVDLPDGTVKLVGTNTDL